MDENPQENAISGVPKQVLDSFVNSLESAGVSKEVVDRLQKTLLVEGNTGETALRQALFADTAHDKD